jgi:outer membrane lipoprotein SlyB
MENKPMPNRTPNLFHRSHRLPAAAVCLAGLICASHASAQVSRTQVGSTFQVVYGTVLSVEETEMEPTTSAAQGAAMGGAVGLVASHHDRGENAAKAAAAGALIAGLVARHQRKNAPSAYIYSVSLNQGGESRIITDHGDIRIDDCVSMEFGQSNNIRRVSDTHCQPDHQEVLALPDVQAAAQTEATECHNAKEVALAAETDEQLELAMKKIRIFCES